MTTESTEYAERLQRLAGARWKRLLNVQAPYRRRLRRYNLGVTLDVGCGIGRNLPALTEGSHGVDHNPDSIRFAHGLGLSACTTDYLVAYPDHHVGRYDSLLFAHVLEHMTRAEGEALVGEYLRYLKPGGRVLLICPQERGYRSDETHVEYLDGADLQGMAREAGLIPEPPSSFPLPKRAGRWFTYNETHVLSRLDA